MLTVVAISRSIENRRQSSHSVALQEKSDSVTVAPVLSATLGRSCSEPKRWSKRLKVLEHEYSAPAAPASGSDPASPV
jgi:uncharacterized protein HemY